MNILDLVLEIGLQPKKMGSTNGGEYKSACPNCKMGHDRFCIWPNQGIAGKYWCRQCHCHGDAIQFCRDFLKLSYIAACAKVNISPRMSIPSRARYYPFQKYSCGHKLIIGASEKWQQAAKQFIEQCHQKLLDTPNAVHMLLSRGLTIDSIKKFYLGWNPDAVFDNRTLWGLPLEINEKGCERTQWLPKGIVIPVFESGVPMRIKIRRTDWHPEDRLPKYVEISGSVQKPSIYGNLEKPVVILESELDSVLIQQFASDLCCCIAMGSVSKKPDATSHMLLKKAPLILLAFDYDEAGKKGYLFWMSQYSNLRPWPASAGKSPGDSYLLGIDLRQWIMRGLSLTC